MKHIPPSFLSDPVSGLPTLPRYQALKPKGHTFRYASIDFVKARQAEALEHKNKRRAENGLPPLDSYSQI